MKAIRIHTFGEPEVMQLEEVPDPRPAAGQVVVRVHAVGIAAVGPEVEEVAEAPRAHHAVMETRAYGKIVLIP